MAQANNSSPSIGQGGDDLSSVKRALIEIRRLRAELDASRRGHGEPVAIIGMAVRLPGGVTSPERFWKALAEGEDLVTTIPPERWSAGAYWSSDAQQPGTMYDIHGGFLSDIDAFDADFFGIHSREAASMDPQQRILLELTWEALERARIDPRSLMNTQTGIYLGLSNSDYARLLTERAVEIDGYTGVGAAASVAAGRIAYFLGTHGPALVIDTACSSSLVAVHQAVQSLRRGETDLAIVGAANLILSPDMNISFSRTGMLSPEGRCKTFDASADGYVRAEGCCILVMKRLAEAVRDGDRVMANVRGTAVNQDGRSAGITAPNGPAQEAVMRAALRDAELKPDAVDYIEAHGTGTPLGDPMEVHAIGAVYGSSRSSKSPLRIGSVKTNLGHTEAAAGLTGLIKVVLMMQPTGGIAPHLHFKQPSPQIDWERWPIEIPQRLIPWSRNGAIRYAGVSSFGFSGTNAHLILSSVEEPASGEIGREVVPPVFSESLLCLSAAHEDSLRVLAERYIDFLRESKNSFADICYAAAIGRAKLPQRLALRANRSEIAAQVLEQWLAGHPVAGLMTNAEDAPEPSMVTRGALEQIQKEFAAGGTLRYDKRAQSDALRSIDLPIYPFQRKRFWFGAPPLVKRQRQREVAWQAMRMEAERQSRQGPLGWSPADHPERWKILDRLTRAHAQNVLVAAGAFTDGNPLTADHVLQGCGFQPIYLNLVRRWLFSLAAAGELVETNGSFRSVGALQPVNLGPYWQDTERWLADDPGTLAYLKQCGALLGEVVAGRKSALETLFPDGSFDLAEGLYEGNVEARYFNPIVASALRALAYGSGNQRSVRILELGGGTGGTTSTVLPLLPSGQVEYWFTDVSELFLSRARRKFAEYRYVHYARLDIDRPIEEQGFAPGRFDAIVAANVVHAARNLESALHRIKALLSDDGVLVLLETTHHHSWFDMSTGLIEGWQHFEDADRRDHPLLTPEQWRGVLERAGFEDMVELPASGSQSVTLGQHVLLAGSSKTPGIQSQKKTESQASTPQQMEGQAKAPISLPEQENDLIAEELLALPQEKRDERVSQVVRETVCAVFQLDIRPDDLTDRDRLSDLGMDSLIALELRGELSKRLGLGMTIPSTIAFDTGTVGELVRALAALAGSQTEKPLPLKASDERRASVPKARQGHVTAEQLETMSEEDVERLLTERLSRR
jgi:3-oxoacyl-(acyl-carrier-protein) synthase/SAM-dependent methyltransferase/acyl carrier protein